MSDAIVSTFAFGDKHGVIEWRVLGAPCSSRKRETPLKKLLKQLVLRHAGAQPEHLAGTCSVAHPLHFMGNARQGEQSWLSERCGLNPPDSETDIVTHIDSASSPPVAPPPTPASPPAPEVLPQRQNIFTELSPAVLWDAMHFVAGCVASVPHEHKLAAVEGVLAGLRRLLPPVPDVRPAVFESHLRAEVL